MPSYGRSLSPPRTFPPLKAKFKVTAQRRGLAAEHPTQGVQRCCHRSGAAAAVLAPNSDAPARRAAGSVAAAAPADKLWRSTAVAGAAAAHTAPAARAPAAPAAGPAAPPPPPPPPAVPAPARGRL
eukprot:scaffold6694_cov33-Phaeocystis_antarctica.AAC.2